MSGVHRKRMKRLGISYMDYCYMSDWNIVMDKLQGINKNVTLLRICISKTEPKFVGLADLSKTKLLPN